MRTGLIGAIVLVIFFGAACSKRESEPASGSPPGQESRVAETKMPAAAEVTVAVPPQPETPATLTDVNLVATDVGGGIDDLTGSYGP